MNKSLEQFSKIVEELKETNSATEKIKRLAKYKDDPAIIKYFFYIYNPFYMYGVTSASMKKNSQLSELEFYKDIFEVLDLLRTRKLTGNKAIAAINGFANQNTPVIDLIYDIMDRKLGIGMGEKQINKALNNVIPTFDVALAATYDKERHDKYGLENYFIQRKLNGVRLVTVITYNADTDSTEIKSYSRKGKEFTTCGKINEEILKFYKASKFYKTNIVLDGEACVTDFDGKEDWNKIVSEIKRKDHTIQSPKYIIFDLLTLDEFSGISQSKKYSMRLKQLMNNFFGAIPDKAEYLSFVFSVPYSKESFDRLEKEYVLTDKWEGFIFRHDQIFKSGRSTDLLKYKLFKDAEYEVIGVENTVKPMLNGEKMVETPCVGALQIKLENGSICGVGTGLSDQQRIDWYNHPEQIIGKQVQVKYKELTKNQDGTWSLQFPVLTHIFEEENRDF